MMDILKDNIDEPIVNNTSTFTGPNLFTPTQVTFKKPLIF